MSAILPPIEEQSATKYPWHLLRRVQDLLLQGSHRLTVVSNDGK